MAKAFELFRENVMATKTFKGKMLRIHVNEQDLWDDKPLYKAIVEVCLATGVAGATVYQGMEGFGLSAHIHKTSIWSFNSNPPVMISIVDTAEGIGRLLPRLDEMVKEGLVAISDVEVTRYFAL